MQGVFGRLEESLIEEEVRRKNRCKDIAHTYSYTTDLDYVVLETKSICLVDHCWLLNTEKERNPSDH
jgi:hypothetical protein